MGEQDYSTAVILLNIGTRRRWSQLPVPAVLFPEKQIPLTTKYPKTCVGFLADLNTLEKGKANCSCRNSNYNSPNVKSVAESLYSLSYPSSSTEKLLKVKLSRHMSSMSVGALEGGGWSAPLPSRISGKEIGTHFTAGCVGVCIDLDESGKTRQHRGFEPQTL